MTDRPAPVSRTTPVSDATTLHTQVTTGPPLVRAVVRTVAAWRIVRERTESTRRWLVQTVTAAGWVVVGFATIGIAVGWLFGWVEWMLAGLASMLLLAMAVPFLFGARGYEVTVRLRHERVVAGGIVEGDIDIRNVRAGPALPGRIDLPVGSGLVELGVPLLRAGHRVAQPVTIPARRRGVILVGPPTAVRTDPIGLLRREHEWDDVHELYVHPRTADVPSTSAGLVHDLEGNPSRRLVEADMSFHAIREYVPGDSRRQIHWKSTAKTGQLMVRQFEESLRSRLAVVLSLAESEYAGDDEFELAVSAAASLSVQAVRDGRDLRVVTGGEIPRAVRGRLRSIETLSATTPRSLLDSFSRLAARVDTMPVEEVCRLTAESADTLSLAFLVCGSGVPLSRLRQASLAFSVNTAVVAVICDEQAHPRVKRVGDLTVLTVGTLDDLAGLLLRGVQS